MQYEGVRWVELEEEEQRQALEFAPQILAATFHDTFTNCVKRDEEEDGDAFNLGETRLNWGLFIIGKLLIDK